MKKLNKIYCFFLLLLVFLISYIHDLKAQVSIGPKIGMGLSTFTTMKSDGIYDAYPVKKSIVTPQVGIMVNIELTRIFSVRPELLYNQRGFRVENNFYGPASKFDIRINYIELPINLLLSGSFGPGRLEVFGGPSIAYGFGGKGKYEVNGDNKSIEVHSGKHPDEPAQFDIQYYNPFNASLNVGFGYKIKSVIVQFAYNIGLTNTQCHFSNSTLEENRNSYVTKAWAFTFGVAYLFEKKNK